MEFIYNILYTLVVFVSEIFNICLFDFIRQIKLIFIDWMEIFIEFYFFYLVNIIMQVGIVINFFFKFFINVFKILFNKLNVFIVFKL